MNKILGSWSGMRKYLEQEMLAESLQGRIRYGCTSYVGMDGCHIFEICIDGKQVKRFSWETVNSYFIDNGYTSNKNPSGIGEYWAEFWSLLDKYPVTDRTEYTDEEFCNETKQLNEFLNLFVLDNRHVKEDNKEYTDEEFCNALENYRHQDIHENLQSNNPLIRMFAILDRRVGKRTLTKLKSELDKQPNWLRQIYLLRIEAELN